MSDRPTFNRVTRAELEQQRASLLAEAGMSYERMRAAAEAWILPVHLLDVWHTIEGIDYLLEGEA